MSKKAGLYQSVTLAQATKFINAVGHKITTLVEGEVGIGKSSILWAFKELRPTYKLYYVEMTTKDIGDLMVPKIHTLDDNGTAVDVTRFVTSEELGMHLQNERCVIMLDEIGKTKGAVQNACLRWLHERRLGIYSMHPESILFATTNLSVEGVGDKMPIHMRNRITTLRVTKPSADEWVDNYAIPNNLEPVVIAMVKEFPQMLASFEEYEKPEQNVYINDPRTVRAAFVTPRSLEKASHIYASMKALGDMPLLAHALAGTIGEPAMNEMLTIINLDMKMPSWDEIVEDPVGTPAPGNAAAACLTVCKAVQRVSKDNLPAWMAYMEKMQKEAQGLFARSVMSPRCMHRDWLSTNGIFSKWVHTNHYLFVK